jgi:hypothetical protein
MARIDNAGVELKHTTASTFDNAICVMACGRFEDGASVMVAPVLPSVQDMALHETVVQ